MLGKKNVSSLLPSILWRARAGSQPIPLIYFMNKGTFTFVAALNDKKRRKQGERGSDWSIRLAGSKSI
jgi:hypothetical protein